MGAQETFAVHEELFTTHSVYFRNAIKGKFTEAQERVVTLKEVAPKVFQTYVILLYTSAMATKGPDEWLELCRIYVLAEYLVDIYAKNKTIDAMYAYLAETLPTEPMYESPEKPFSAESLQVVYDGTPEGSPLRRLCVDLYALHGRKAWLKNAKAEEFPPEFLYDIAVKLLQVGGPFPLGQILSRPASDYHEHIVTEEKAAETPPEAIETTEANRLPHKTTCRYSFLPP